MKFYFQSKKLTIYNPKCHKFQKTIKIVFLMKANKINKYKKTYKIAGFA